MPADDTELSLDSRQTGGADAPQKTQKQKQARAWYLANRDRLLADARARRATNREQCRQYARAYRAANRDKQAEHERAWYAKNREYKAEQNRIYRAKNKERIAAEKRAYYIANLERDRERRQKYNRARYAADPEREANRKRAYREANPQKVREMGIANVHRRRARESAVENTFTASDWQTLVARSKHCHWCKKPFSKTRRPTHDHVIPISKGGANTIENSVCACKTCNSRKHNRLVNPATGQGILL